LPFIPLKFLEGLQQTYIIWSEQQITFRHRPTTSGSRSR